MRAWLPVALPAARLLLAAALPWPGAALGAGTRCRLS